MLKRIVTGVLLLAAAFLLIAFQGWYLRGAILVIAILSMREMFEALAARGMAAVRWPAYAFALLFVLAESFSGWLWWMSESPLLMAFLLTSLMGIVSVVLIGKPDFDCLIATLLPILYPGLFYAFLLKLASLPGRGVSTVALAMAVLLPSMNDTFALFIGKALGRRKLIPGISPNKTVAGSVAGIAASVVFGMLVPVALHWADARINGAEGAVALSPLWAYALFGLFAGALSQLGDLTASLIKRACGIKDYGKLFPGHGGMMDRMDAILFGGVACYLFFMLTGH